MAENTNAYAILGITKGASDKDVKIAYVNLVKKYDPEKHTDRFMVIQQAYDRLRQTKTRAKEDVHSYNMVSGEYLFQDDEKCQGDVPPPESEVARARARFLENMLSEETKRAFCTLLSARAHYASIRKQFNEAIRDWSEILEIDPSNVRARQNLELACSNLGISYALHGLYEEGIELFEKALQLNPDNTNLIHNLALVSERASDPQRAGKYWAETVTRWKASLAKDPENEYLRQCIIEALNHHGVYMEAHRRDLERSAPPPPPKSVSAIAMPSTLGNRKFPGLRSSGSSDNVRLPSGNSPQPPPAPTTGGGMTQLERYREILSLNPNDFDAHYHLCNELMKQESWVEAEKELTALSRKHPKNTEVLNLLGWALLNNSQKDNAFSCWKRSMAIDPKNPQTLEQLVRAHLQMGKAFRSKGIFTQALVHFKQLLALMPKSAEVHLEIAATYDMKGDVRSAVQEYNAVLELDPKNKAARKAVNDLRNKR